ncbi:translocation protein [Aulographum hederae CBS 113979]|uniref:Translocation protein SEC62 n=1 Tax=Aulographum hederae CBS 113979 TaxID=1176131 RepID=A0A6G1HH58_9PEZI|nr:translocation protein [Aulographum hederae CBS 113979]
MQAPQLQPGQQPTPEQIRAMQEQIAREAAEHGISVQEYVERLKAQAMQQHQAQMAQQQQMQQQQQQQMQQAQQVPLQPGPPTPEAMLVANFLRSRDLKTRTALLQEKRRDMFRVKRAIRALESDDYKKLRAKHPNLPEVRDRATAENTFKLLPLSMLALRVSKVDPHAGHNHGKQKRVKGLWHVQIEQQQEAEDDNHYIWLYEGSQWKTKLYALGALLLVMTIVLFPLWPLKMRQGVWYLSMCMMGLIGLFFAMAFFRLILFCVTYFVASPGLWLYPNLFEDVGFFDSFKPLWGWQEVSPAISTPRMPVLTLTQTDDDIKRIKQEKKDKKAAKRARAANGGAHPEKPAVDSPTMIEDSEKTTTTSSDAAQSGAVQRARPAVVEDADDDE